MSSPRSLASRAARTRLLLSLACAALAAPPGATASAQTSGYVAPERPLGLNLAAVTYYSTAVPFVDLFRQSDQFFSTNAAWTEGDENKWDTGLIAKIPRGAGGYPKSLPLRVRGSKAPQIARIAVASAVYPGRYVVLYDGDGELRFTASPVELIDARPGRMEVQVAGDASAQLFLDIVRSRAGKPVRNIRMVPIAHEQDYARTPFHPRFLERIRGASALRFMDWGATNNSRVRSFAERALPGASEGTKRGASYETMLALAAQNGSDAWICVPHEATDDYVRKLAQLIKQRLPKQRRVYVEFSNEVWNSLFTQSAYASQQGCKRGLAKLGEYKNARGCVDDSAKYWAGVKWYARRSGEVFKLMDRVFGSERTRLVRVLAGQSGFDEQLRVMLAAAADPRINTARARADVLAIAPYFGHNYEAGEADPAQLPVPSADAVLDQLEQHALPEALAQVERNVSLAREHGLGIVAYEGGQHLVALGALAERPALVAVLTEANRAPRMEQLYTRYLEGYFSRTGNSLMNLFTLIDPPSKYGAWGLLEQQEAAAEASPKYRAYAKALAR